MRDNEFSGINSLHTKKKVNKEKIVFTEQRLKLNEFHDSAPQDRIIRYQKVSALGIYVFFFVVFNPFTKMQFRRDFSGLSLALYG